MRSSKSSTTLRSRPKSAGTDSHSLLKSKSKSSLRRQKRRTGSQTERAASRSQSFQKQHGLIPWRSRRRHPRIDDGVHKRYPEWRMSGPAKAELIANAISPGPIYIPKDSFVLPSEPAWSLGRQLNRGAGSFRSPGPIYNPKYNFTHYDAPKFSMHSRRAQKSNAQSTPAPNQYNVDTGKHGRQYTLKGRLSRRTDTLSSTPGPSSYDVSKSQRKHAIPSTKIGFRLPDQTQKFLKTVPGPAHYMPKFDATLHRASGWTMGARTKIIDSRDENPGPGYYGPPLVPPFRKRRKKKTSRY